MTSPLLESFCCQYNASFISPIHNPGQVKDWYQIICIASSSVSIAGSLFQIWPRYESEIARARKEAGAQTNDLKIVHCLALADLLASFGILIRSVVWLALLSGKTSMATIYPAQRSCSEPSETYIMVNLEYISANYFCAIISAWIHYFYITTYLWTFFFALDIFLNFKCRQGKMWIYHVFTWGLALVLSVAGLVPLYSPSLRNCGHSVHNLLPHYLTGLIPIMFVMLVNPILYLVSSFSVKTFLASQYAKYTERERRAVAAVREKFFLVVLVFFICWSPNIVNSSLLFAARRQYLDEGTYNQLVFKAWLALWFVMAVLNPLQAFLNVLVYHGWKSWQNLQCPCSTEHWKVKLLADSLRRGRDESLTLSSSIREVSRYGSYGSQSDSPNNNVIVNT